jgi:hypothetical protein
MDWKTPPMLLGGINAMGLLGLFFWSYKKFGTIDSRLDQHDADIKKWYEEVGGQDGKLFQRVQQKTEAAFTNVPILYSENDETQDELNNVIETTADLRKFMIDFLAYLSTIQNLQPEEQEKLKALIKKAPKKHKPFKKSNHRKERERQVQEMQQRTGGGQNRRSSKHEKKKRKGKAKKKDSQKEEKQKPRKSARKKEDSSSDENTSSDDSDSSSSESGFSEDEILLRGNKR